MILRRGFAPRRRLLLGRCGQIGLGALLLAAAAQAMGWRSPRDARGRVIRFGHDMPDAEFVAEHVRDMEKTGLDGIVIDFTRRSADAAGKESEVSLRSQWVSGSPIRRDEIRHNIEALRATRFRHFTDNFLVMYANTQYGPECFFRWDRSKYDTSRWGGGYASIRDPDGYLNAFRANMILAAQICRELGLKGFFIDTERYGSWAQMRMDVVEGAFGEDKQTLADRARRNVTEVFGRVFAVYPDLTILFIQGSLSTYEEAPTLKRAFIDGILTAMQEYPRARLVDGQESAYDHTLYKRFVATRARSFAVGMAHSDVPLLYEKRMQFGFGVWLDHRARALGGFSQDQELNHFTAAELGNALHYAMRAGDGYVWLYGEDSVFWEAGSFAPGASRAGTAANVPEAYKDAIAGARAWRPLDRGRDPRGADTEPLPAPAASLASTGSTFATAAPNLEMVTKLDAGWEIFFDREDRALWSYQEVLKGDDDVPWIPIEVGEYWERQNHRYNGTAVYRCRFTIPDEFAGRKLFLILGGVADSCHVQLNRGWVASTARTPDVLDLLTYGKPKFGDEAENVLCIYVVNMRGPGGLWQPVWIGAGDEIPEDTD